MFVLPVNPTSEGIRTSPTVLLDPENVGVAVGISFLSYIQAEIYDIACVLPVMAAMFDLPVTSTSESIHICPAVLLDVKDGGCCQKFGESLHAIYIWSDGHHFDFFVGVA